VAKSFFVVFPTELLPSSQQLGLEAGAALWELRLLRQLAELLPDHGELRLDRGRRIPVPVSGSGEARHEPCDPLFRQTGLHLQVQRGHSHAFNNHVVLWGDPLSMLLGCDPAHRCPSSALR